MAGKTSKWKQVMSGASVLTFGRVFVVGLTVVSLAVWTVTVIGLGVLRENSGYPSTVQTAHGAAATGDLLVPVTPLPPALPEASPAADVKSTLQPAMLGAAQSPDIDVSPEAALSAVERDPFAVSETRFPQPVRTAKVGALQETAPQDDSAAGLKRDQLLPLRLEGTLILGPDPVAIIGGNSFEVEGRTMLLMLGEISSKYRAGDKTITAKATTTHFKVGDTLEVRPVTVGDDRVRIHGETEAVMLTVSRITNNSVELTLGEKTYVLRMTK